MDQLMPSLQRLLAPLAVAFRSEVYSSFCLMAVAWIVCLGRRTAPDTRFLTGPRHVSTTDHLFARYSERTALLGSWLCFRRNTP